MSNPSSNVSRHPQVSCHPILVNCNKNILHRKPRRVLPGDMKDLMVLDSALRRLDLGEDRKFDPRILRIKSDKALDLFMPWLRIEFDFNGFTSSTPVPRRFRRRRREKLQVGARERMRALGR